MVMTAVGAFVGDLALGVAKTKVGKAIDKGLSGNAVKAAIQQAVSAADGEVPELFAPYERQGLKGIDGFLQGAFREVAMLNSNKGFVGNNHESFFVVSVNIQYKTHNLLFGEAICKLRSLYSKERHSNLSQSKVAIPL